MKLNRYTMPACFVLVSSVILCACSYQATASISVGISDLPRLSVIQSLEKIGMSLAYARGTFSREEDRSSTILEDETRYRLYFVNNDLRTSIVIEIPKNEAPMKIVFSEFGVKVFTPQGAEQHRLLVNSIIAVFGEKSVFAGAPVDLGSNPAVQRTLHDEVVRRP